MQVEFSHMSPLERLKIKEDIKESKEWSTYSAAIEQRYPIYRIQYQIIKDYISMTSVDREESARSLDRRFIQMAAETMTVIKETTLPPDEMKNAKRMCEKEIDNSLENSLNFYDRITMNYKEYQLFNNNNELFEELDVHMKRNFYFITNQVKDVFCFSDHKEINGEIFSKLLILNWKIINDTIFTYYHDNVVYPQIVFAEYLIQSCSTISVSHGFEFKTKEIMGYNSPLVTIFHRNIQVEVKFKSQKTDFQLMTILDQDKYEGLVTGFIFLIGEFRLYCKELFVDSHYYQDNKKDYIRSYIESLKKQKAVLNFETDYSNSHINTYQEQFHILHKYEANCLSKTEGNSITLTDNNFNSQGDRILNLLQKYINPYAESISYLLLYFLGFMPPVSIFKSIIWDKIYLIISQVPNFDEELQSRYVLGAFYHDWFLARGKKLNNICTCFHTFLIFNYMFHLGDFHDRNYSICSQGDKFKIKVFDLWMSPFQIRTDEIIHFLGCPYYDETNHLNASLGYYLLYWDKSRKLENGSKYTLSNLMISLQGHERLPFITIKALKTIFSNAIKNLDKIFNNDKPELMFYSQMVDYYKQAQNRLCSCYLIEKIYDSSRELLLKNPNLVDYYLEFISFDDYTKYYQVDENDQIYFQSKIESHKYLVNFSTQKLTQLYEKLLEVTNMKMIFIKKPFHFHVYGSSNLIEEHREYQKVFTETSFSSFIKNPHDVNWIFVFFSIEKDLSSFFSDSQFLDTENQIIEHFSVPANGKCFFIVFNDIVLCDMYRINLSNLKYVEDWVTDRYYHSLLFSYKNSIIQDE